jgi:hypothetical protein
VKQHLKPFQKNFWIDPCGFQIQRSFSFAPADQARTDFAIIESGLEFLMQRIAQLPTVADLWRATLLIAFVSAVLGIVGIEAFCRYFPACGSI